MGSNPACGMNFFFPTLEVFWRALEPALQREYFRYRSHVKFYMCGHLMEVECSCVQDYLRSTQAKGHEIDSK